MSGRAAVIRTVAALGLVIGLAVDLGHGTARAEPGSLPGPGTVSGYRFVYVASRGSVALDVNGCGEVVGWYSTGRGFVWQAGRTRYLRTLGGRTAEPHGINDKGQVVGSSGTASGHGRAVLWSGTGVRDLGVDGTATAINNHGTIVGVAFPAKGTPYAWRWSGGRLTSLTRYGIHRGNATYVYDVNDAGQIVGVDDAGGFLLTGTHLTRLRGLSGRPTSPRSVNRHGDIAGGEAVRGMPYQALLWSQAHVRALRPVPAPAPGAHDPTGIAHGINDAGLVVGESWWSGTPVTPLPFVSSRGTTVRLPTPAIRPTGVARAVNGHGLVVGQVRSTGAEESFAAAWIPDRPA